MELFTIVLIAGLVGLFVAFVILFNEVNDSSRREHVLLLDRDFRDDLMLFQAELSEVKNYRELHEVVGKYLAGRFEEWTITIADLEGAGSPFLLITNGLEEDGQEWEEITFPIYGEDALTEVAEVIIRTSSLYVSDQIKDQLAPVVSLIFTVARRIRSSLKDDLTRLWNREHLDHSLEGEIDRSRRMGHTFSFLALDLDGFKEINDNLGHQKGDEVLVAIAKLLTLDHREYDVVARPGGDEFCLILPETSVAGAVKVAEEIRDAIERLDFDEHYRLTSSIGVAEYPTAAANGLQLKEAADKALYNAKRAGKNRIAVWEPQKGGD